MSASFDLSGRTAIVCGASTGIGLGIAEALAAANANLLMFANETADLEREAERLGAVAVAGDFTVEHDLERLVEAGQGELGLHIVVHNGGAAADTEARTMGAESIERGVSNLLAPMVRLTQLALPHLERSGAGRVIAITSSSVREPIPGMATSNVFRAAAAGWLKTLSREVGPSGVTVNSVGPGRISTRTLEAFYAGRSRDEDLAEIPLRRFGTPREVGDVVCFLASDAGAYLTGAHIPVDGGLSRQLS